MPARLWEEEGKAVQMAADAAAYRKMLDEGSLDRCGVILPAGKAVGAPFMGVAATLVLSEVLRLHHGGDLHRLIDVNLVDLAYSLTAPSCATFQSSTLDLPQRERRCGDTPFDEDDAASSFAVGYVRDRLRSFVVSVWMEPKRLSHQLASRNTFN